MKNLLALLTLVVLFSSCTKKVKLELNLQKDSTYYIAMNVKMDIDQLIQGNHQISKTTLTGTTVHKVTGIRDTLYDMDVSYKKIAMSMDIGGNVLSFNSTGDTSNIFNRLLKSMSNKVFNITMSRRGEVVAVRNVDNLFKNMFNQFPDLDEEKRAQILIQLNQSFGEKAIKGNFQESFVVFPTEQVGVKDTWTNQTNLEAAAVSTKTKNTYTLETVTDAEYEISGKSVIMPDKSPDFRNNNTYFTRFVDVKGSNLTKLKIDKKTGWISESHIIKHIVGTMEIKQALEDQSVMSYPMVIDADSSVKNKQE